ncbi:CMP-N-acetylneuraminate-beta-galactosamide-alpha-2,3-sialyltransferase 4 [Liparis tanakae]|uniref:CMP-N-acetylneuraminate-beta-galactosamide-alpha-2,3-sialyltransferase 4 n=1 Tax=Liparis tanakae TaxID=230148 RepID=A0A4Z2ID17_9TELE|nr:CMP-N-acetylneuraminate-beta-galactosamide-alpha-2,3-sialyltransferase 4 [Liparis tanakae]
MYLSYGGTNKSLNSSKSLCGGWITQKKWESLNFNISRQTQLFLKLEDFFWREHLSKLALPYGIKGSELLLLKVLALIANYQVPTNIENLECRTCVIIGNGFAIKNSSLGSIINKYDVPVHPTTGILAVFVALNYCDVVHVAGFGYPNTKNQRHPIHYYGYDTMKSMKNSYHDLNHESEALKRLEDILSFFSGLLDSGSAPSVSLSVRLSACPGGLDCLLGFQLTWPPITSVRQSIGKGRILQSGRCAIGGGVGLVDIVEAVVVDLVEALLQGEDRREAVAPKHLGVQNGLLSLIS